ncbi:MAG: MFS transporter [Alphaproteobacteria bacterium]|nr:MFS transporter [Alphaproteobacteria bacterium]
MADGLEAGVMRKVMWRLVPLLSLCYCINVLDRFNVSVAALTMNKALGLSATTYGLGAGAFFWSYTLFQMPANAALSRVGARRWITGIAVAWGLCSAGTALATGVTTFVIARFMLGVAEAGFFPGVAYFMTCWFPSRYRGRAMGIFYACGSSAGILVGPISANLLSLDGWLGIAGWQWVFLVEGLPTLCLASLCPFVLRDGPADAKWLRPDERDWLETRLKSEREAALGRHLKTLRAIMSPQLILLTAVYLLVGFGVYSKGFFLPLILKTFGFADITVGYLNSVPAAAGVIGMIIFSQSSDRTGERVWHLVTPLLIGGAGMMLAGVAIGMNAPLTVAAFAIAAFGISGSLPVFWNLPTAFLGSAAAAGGIAFINSVGNISGYAAPQFVGLLRDMSGSYQMPMLTMGLMVAIGGVIVPLAARLRPTASPSPVVQRA